jgi:hypothetical protein
LRAVAAAEQRKRGCGFAGKGATVSLGITHQTAGLQNVLKPGSARGASWGAVTVLFGLLAGCLILPIRSFAVSGLVREGIGAILGRVLEDAGKTPVPAAAVTVRNQTTGIEYTSRTSVDGVFFVTSLPAGRYTVSASCVGFEKTSLSDYPVRLAGFPAAEPVQIDLVKSGAGQNAGNAIRTFVAPALQTEPIVAESQAEVRVRWESGGNLQFLNAAEMKQKMGTGAFSVVELRKMEGLAPRQRMPELSSNQILIAVLDKEGNQIDWVLIPDPRIIRAESPGPNGELSGQILYRSDAEFLVPISQGISAAGIKIYQPHWSGEEFTLDLLGTISLH